MRNNWDEDLPSEGMKAKISRKWHVFYFAWMAETRSTVKVLFILYLASDPESELEPESESIRNPESELESEQPHHDSAPLLRTAYYVLSKSLSQTSFVELVLQHMNDLNMGNINHSKAFMSQARDMFYQQVITNLTEHVQRQPCVALSADKATVIERTVDITAITTVVPEAPGGSMIQSCVVGVPVVKERDSNGHAQQLQGTFASLGITRTEQLSAIAADGLVHHNRVPTKLLRAMSVGSATPACLPRIWDGAHLMNLADLDARSATSCRKKNRRLLSTSTRDC